MWLPAPLWLRLRGVETSLCSLAVLLLALIATPTWVWAQDGGLPGRLMATPMEPKCLSSSRVLVGYQLAPHSPSATGAELWYTHDAGQTWRRWGGGPTRDNPISFEPPEDGLYGFCVIPQGPNGATEAPKSGAAPRRSVCVDRTAPTVQLLRLKADPRFDLNRQLHLRWTVQDEHLPDRPTALHYRCEQAKTFQLVADSLPADASYTWTVPENISGQLEIRISAMDTAGNTGRYVAEWLKIEGSAAVDSRSGQPRAGRAGITVSGRQKTALSHAETAKTDRTSVRPPILSATQEQARNQASGLPPAYGEPDAGTQPVSSGAVAEAKNRYDLGTWHRLRGEHDVATARFREALKLDPDLLAARNDLAGLLYLQGDYEGAEQELQCVLSKDERHRPALKTLALVQASRRAYRSSRESLEKLLLLDADDAEAWLYLGDVRLFMGDRSAAREAWSKAASVGSASEETKQRAQKRLDIYRSDRFQIAPSE
jgi:tetratricopeptide (TPR) repeat protein